MSCKYSVQDQLKSSNFNHFKAWLQKLCGAVCPNKESKRNRNIFLSHLVLCMQDKKLTGPFQESPNDVDLTETSKYFGELQQNLQV